VVLTFPVPGEPPSVNKSPRSRGAAIGWSKKRQEWRDTCAAYAAEHPVISRGLPPSMVQVTIPFSTNRRRDPHNYTGTVVKWIIDGLVKAGAWPDDNEDWVSVVDSRLVVGNEVSVLITERNVRTMT